MLEYSVMKAPLRACISAVDDPEDLSERTVFVSGAHELTRRSTSTDSCIWYPTCGEGDPNISRLPVQGERGQGERGQGERGQGETGIASLQWSSKAVWTAITVKV
jgi:hypothetical protein